MLENIKCTLVSFKFDKYFIAGGRCQACNFYSCATCTDTQCNIWASGYYGTSGDFGLEWNKQCNDNSYQGDCGACTTSGNNITCNRCHYSLILKTLSSGQVTWTQSWGRNYYSAVRNYLLIFYKL
jgi:hypothetical protein